MLYDLEHNAPGGMSSQLFLNDHLGSAYSFEFTGDSLYSNYLPLLTYFSSRGYYLEEYHSLASVDLSLYSSLLLLDPEHSLSDSTQHIIHSAMEHSRLDLIVISDHSLPPTSPFPKPVSPACNTVSLNSLLCPFGITLSTSQSVHGTFSLNHSSLHYQSGTFLLRFPSQGFLLGFPLHPSRSTSFIKQLRTDTFPVLGLTSHKASKIIVYGDSACFDSSSKYEVLGCTQLFDLFLCHLQDTPCPSLLPYRLPLPFQDTKYLPSNSSLLITNYASFLQPSPQVSLGVWYLALPCLLLSLVCFRILHHQPYKKIRINYNDPCEAEIIVI